MKRKALCIGINNYPGKDHDLLGCVNDADDWAAYLGGLGYQAAVLADAQATKRNILASIALLTSGLKPGDSAVITYSGHGTWVPDYDGDETDGRDEAICPHDMGYDGANLIIDDELAALFADRAAGSRLYVVTDSCHSGTVFRAQEFPWQVKKRAKFFPPAEFFKDPEKLAAATRRALTDKKKSNAPLAGVVHLSGCSDSQFSYDSEFAGRPNGALTATTLGILARGKRRKTNAELLAAVGRKLPSIDYPQTPRLNCTADLRRVVAFE